jgi:peptidoglycan/xylan/chitin deacetylase (PgdA/CDA1 family)
MKLRMTRRDFLQALAAATAMTFLPFRSIAFPGASPGRPVPVLLYHEIDELKQDEYTMLAPVFAAQMEWLYGNGYQAISLQDLGEGRIPEKPVVITFDDGYASFLFYVLPLMEHYGFKTTLNIIGRYAGTYIGMNRPMISWDEYRYLAGIGLVSFGCHTNNLHTFAKGGVKNASQEDLYRDLMSFQETMLREVKMSSDILAWPYGLYNRRSMETAGKAGFKYLLTSNPGVYRVGQSLREIPRINVGGGIDLKAFKKISGEG